jgi:hypothetical protein
MTDLEKWGKWYEGIPPIEVVAENEIDYERPDGVNLGRIVVSDVAGGREVPVENSERWGNWIGVGNFFLTPYMPAILRLRVADGKILLSEGFCAWGILSEHKLADRARYFPIDSNRLPRGTGMSYCSYCGEVKSLSGKSADERSAMMLGHILTCPKRPEMKMLGVALAAAEAVEAFDEVPDDEAAIAAFDPARFEKSMAHLADAVKKLKVKPGADS